MSNYNHSASSTHKEDINEVGNILNDENIEKLRKKAESQQRKTQEYTTKSHFTRQPRKISFEQDDDDLGSLFTQLQHKSDDKKAIQQDIDQDLVKGQSLESPRKETPKDQVEDDLPNASMYTSHKHNSFSVEPQGIYQSSQIDSNPENMNKFSEQFDRNKSLQAKKSAVSNSSQIKQQRNSNHTDTSLENDVTLSSQKELNGSVSSNHAASQLDQQGIIDDGTKHLAKKDQSHDGSSQIDSFKHAQQDTDTLEQSLNQAKSQMLRMLVSLFDRPNVIRDTGGSNILCPILQTSSDQFQTHELSAVDYFDVIYNTVRKAFSASCVTDDTSETIHVTRNTYSFMAQLIPLVAQTIRDPTLQHEFAARAHEKLTELGDAIRFSTHGPKYLKNANKQTDEIHVSNHESNHSNNLDKKLGQTATKHQPAFTSMHGYKDTTAHKDTTSMTHKDTAANKGTTGMTRDDAAVVSSAKPQKVHTLSETSNNTRIRRASYTDVKQTGTLVKDQIQPDHSQVKSVQRSISEPTDITDMSVHVPCAQSSHDGGGSIYGNDSFGVRMSDLTNGMDSPQTILTANSSNLYETRANAAAAVKESTEAHVPVLSEQQYPVTNVPYKSGILQLRMYGTVEEYEVSERKRYICYIIQCKWTPDTTEFTDTELLEPITWLVSRRYNEFRTLDQEIRRILTGYVNSKQAEATRRSAQEARRANFLQNILHVSDMTVGSASSVASTDGNVSYDDLPSLPGKTFRKGTDPRVVASRKQSLFRYMKQLCERYPMILQNAQMEKFLTLSRVRQTLVAHATRQRQGSTSVGLIGRTGYTGQGSFSHFLSPRHSNADSVNTSMQNISMSQEPQSNTDVKISQDIPTSIDTIDIPDNIHAAALSVLQSITSSQDLIKRRTLNPTKFNLPVDQLKIDPNIYSTVTQLVNRYGKIIDETGADTDALQNNKIMHLRVLMLILLLAIDQSQNTLFQTSETQGAQNEEFLNCLWDLQESIGRKLLEHEDLYVAASLT